MVVERLLDRRVLDEIGKHLQCLADPMTRIRDATGLGSREWLTTCACSAIRLIEQGQSIARLPLAVAYRSGGFSRAPSVRSYGTAPRTGLNIVDIMLNILQNYLLLRMPLGPSRLSPKVG